VLGKKKLENANSNSQIMGMAEEVGKAISKTHFWIRRK
jgi:hypothetical protein